MSSYLDSSWPTRHRRMLAAWIADRSSAWSPAQRAIVTQAEEVLASELGGVVALLGPRGTGKTLIASAVAHNAQARAQRPPGLAARYWVLGDLFAAEKRSWQQGRSGWERCGQAFDRSPLDDAHNVDLLVLDEIQERAESDWEDREMTRLVDARYRACKSTILVGNLKAEELAARLGPSVASRIHEGGAVLLCAWESFRGKS